MKTKIFLLFSYLVFLLSVLYFAFVSISERIQSSNQRQPSKLSAVSNEDYRYAKTIVPSPQHNEFSEFTDAELEAAIELLDALDDESGLNEKPQAQEIQPETSDFGMFEEQDIASRTDPDLEKTFEFYKGNLARHWDIAHKTTPLMNKLVRLDEETDELRACLNNPNWSLRVAILRVNTFKIA